MRRGKEGVYLEEGDHGHWHCSEPYGVVLPEHEDPHNTKQVDNEDQQQNNI